MKHFHSKQQLGDADVKYMIVEEGERLSVRFGPVDQEYNGAQIAQGIKFWLNRCKLAIDGTPIEVGRVIIWHSEKPKAARVAAGHYHCYTNGEVRLSVVETSGEKANLGVFNVWTADNARCYEFTGNSSVSDVEHDGRRKYTARHGWSADDKPTMTFEIERTSTA